MQPDRHHYIGLLAAFVSESATPFVMPALDGPGWGWFWMLVVLATLSVVGGGWWLVRSRLPAAIESTRRPARQAPSTRPAAFDR